MMDATVHEECMVDFARVRTDDFGVWRFVPRDLYRQTTLYGPDPETVEFLD